LGSLPAGRQEFPVSPPIVTFAVIVI